MFEKKIDRVFKNDYNKVYVSDLDIIQILDMIDLEKFPIKKVSFSDNADVGLKAFGGDFNLDEFYVQYSKFAPFIESVNISFVDESLFITVFNDGNISLLSNNNVELEQIVKKKTDVKRF